MRNEAIEPEELGDRVNPNNNIIRKDACYDKGIGNGSGDLVWRPRNAPQARKLQQALYSGKSRTRDKDNHQLMLAKSVSMGNLSTGRRVPRVGPAEMVELNDESSQIQRARNARVLGPGKWSGLGGLVTVTGTPVIHVICVGHKKFGCAS